MIAKPLYRFDKMSQGGWFSALLTVAAGGSLISAFAPLSIGYLIIPGLVWLVLPLRSLTLKEAVVRGLWFNIGFFAVGISWVHVSIYRFGHAPLLLSIPLTAIFIFLLSLYSTSTVFILNRFFSALSERLYFLVALPFVWMLTEWGGSWIFTGFPWLNLGYSQIDSPLSAIAPLMGNAAISYLIVLIAGLIVLTIRQGSKALKTTAPIFLIIVIMVTAVQEINWVETSGKQLTVSLIQPSIAQDKKWRPEEREQTLEYFKQTTEGLDSQLIVWPEGAIPALASQVSTYLQWIDWSARKDSKAVLTGIAIKEGSQYYNASIMLGIGEGQYYKQHLVPFGEYVPFEFIMSSLLEFIEMPMSSFSPGNDDQPLLTVDDWRLAMAICFEIIFQEVVANQILGADVLVTLSNDAWFGDSIGAYQHLAIARMRALENGIPVIRATNDGISALIDHKGRVIGKMDKFHRGVLTDTISAVSGETPFRKIGPHWAYGILIIIPGLILLLALRRQRKS